MRVLFLSDLETAGGAGIAASRLANGLSAEGVEVLRFFGVKTAHHPAEPITWQSEYVGLPRAVEVAVNGLKRVSPELAIRVARRLAAEIVLKAIRETEFDVLHVHAIHNSYWRHDTLARLPPDLPTVWTFHDSWGFSPEAHRFRTLDGSEIRLKPDGEDRTAAQERRRAYFDSRRQLRLVANSRAAASLARDALGLEVQIIHCGLPLNLYQPIDRGAARSALGLPFDAFVMGFSADSGSDPVKGYAVLEAALRRLRHPHAWAIAIGSMDVGDRVLGDTTVRQLGRVDNPRLQAIMYSAADVFVMPSLAEGLGQVGMEAIACGTPVVGSDTGGIPDVVIPDGTGWLFPRADPNALAAILERLAHSPAETRALTGSCRAVAERSWELRERAKDYLEIYRQVLRS